MRTSMRRWSGRTRAWPAGEPGSRTWRGSTKSRFEGGRFGVTVSAVCRQVGITRQNYYARRKARQRREVEAELMVALVIAERQIQPRLGTRKLYFMLKGKLAQEGVWLGRDRFLEVLRQKGLLLEPKPAEYPCTTNSQHSLP